jgi:hypothetical protein
MGFGKALREERSQIPAITRRAGSLFKTAFRVKKETGPNCD